MSGTAATADLLVGTGVLIDHLRGRRRFPEDMDPGPEETSFYDLSNFVFPFGARAAVVEFDRETGRGDVRRYVAVDDCGSAINPNLIDGQVHGGIVHPIGQVLYEQVHYDEAGQLTTGTLAASAAVVNAVIDTVRPLGYRLPQYAVDAAAHVGSHQRARGVLRRDFRRV